MIQLTSLYRASEDMSLSQVASDKVPRMKGRVFVVFFAALTGSIGRRAIRICNHSDLQPECPELSFVSLPLPSKEATNVCCVFAARGCCCCASSLAYLENTHHPQQSDDKIVRIAQSRFKDVAKTSKRVVSPHRLLDNYICIV